MKVNKSSKQHKVTRINAQMIYEVTGKTDMESITSLNLYYRESFFTKIKVVPNEIIENWGDWWIKKPSIFGFEHEFNKKNRRIGKFIESNWSQSKW